MNGMVVMNSHSMIDLTAVMVGAEACAMIDVVVAKSHDMLDLAAVVARAEVYTAVVVVIKACILDSTFVEVDKPCTTFNLVAEVLAMSRDMLDLVGVVERGEACITFDLDDVVATCEDFNIRELVGAFDVVDP